MEIMGCGHGLVARRLAHCLEDDALGIAQALDAKRAMKTQKHAVDGARRAQLVEQSTE